MSSSTKVLLVIIVIAIIFGGFYMFPYKSMSDRETGLKNEINNLQSEYNQLIEELNKKDEYIAGTEAAEVALEELAYALPQNLPQENTISLVHDIETTIGTRISTFTMTDEVIISSLENAANPELSEYGIQSNFQTIINCTYDQLKDLLDYVNNNKYRMVLTNLTMSSTPDTGNLQVVVNLSSYGLRLGTREAVQASLGEYDYGKNSVFEPFDEYSLLNDVSDAYQTSEEDVSDFFILLDPLQSDRTTTTIGRSGDPVRDTYVYDENPGVVSGEIHFYQEDGFYFYRYRVEDDSYPEIYTQSYMFDPGEELEIQILSAYRVDEDDISGLNMNIINETDMVVNIVYYSEDFDNPRFQYTSQGPVEVH